MGPRRAYASQHIRAPGPDHSLPRRSRATGSLFAGLPHSGSGGPTGSPPMADRTRSLGSGMREICAIRQSLLPVFKPIAYVSAGACHDESSSSGRCDPVARVHQGRPTPFAPDGPTFVRREQRNRAGPLRVGTQLADGLGKAAVGPYNVQDRRRRVMTTCHGGWPIPVVDPGSARPEAPTRSLRHQGRRSNPRSRTSGRIDNLDPGPSR